MATFTTRLDPLVAKPEAFPLFEAAVEAVMANRPAHLKNTHGRVDAFYKVWEVAKAVPAVAEVLGLKGYFD
jgi:hypothetical protein